ncbi:unnamed protein product, partial [marine sediment metagenome]
SEMKQETEKALQTSANMVNELSSSLEAKDVTLNDKEAEISALGETISDLELKITELTNEKTALETEKETFETEKADIVKRAEEAENKIAEMEKDQLTVARLSELKETGIVATNEKAIEDQTSKIREMSDEEFSSYKDELVAIREAIVAELKSKEETPGDTTTGEKEGGEKGGSEEDDDDAASDETAAIDPMKATFAALNMELVPGKDVLAKYRDLGKQMADNIAEKKGDK